MPSKYTLHPITSSGIRISMPWDNEEDPTQDEIDTYGRISNPENQSRPQMNFARVNGQDVDVNDSAPSPVQSLARESTPAPVDPLKNSPTLKRILFSQNPAEESLAPDIKQPETYWGGFGKSLYDDYVKPNLSAVGIAGMIGGENEVQGIKKSSIFNKMRGAAEQVVDDEGGTGKPSISDMQQQLKNTLEKAAMDRKIANIQADPKFQKLPSGIQESILNQVRNNPKVFTPKMPKGGVVEPPKVNPPTDQSFRFAPGEGAQPDRSLDIMKQPSMFHPNVHPGSTGIPDVSPVSAADKIPRRIDQPQLPDVAIPDSLARTTGEKAFNVIHGSREIMASMDYSAPARQGAFLIGRKGYWKALPGMFKAGASQAGYDAIQETIESHPHFPLAQKAGIAFTDLGTNLSNREENFMSTLSNYVPGMKGSARAYTGFLNATRMNVFGDLVDSAKKLDLEPVEFQKMIPHIADYVNTATGRGSLGSFEHSAKGLNAVLFAPRLMASRAKLLNPWTYVNPKTPVFVRREALKDLIKFTGVATSILTLAKQAGADVELDPRSSDFGKMRIGNTRIDVAAGFTQYIRLVSGLSIYTYDKLTDSHTPAMKSAATGKLREFGDSPVTPTAFDFTVNFMKNKAAPNLSFVVGFLDGKDIAGQPFNVPKEVAARFTPMIFQDAWDVYQINPELLPLTVPASVVGLGVQSYVPRKTRGGSFFDSGATKGFFDKKGESSFFKP